MINTLLRAEDRKSFQPTTNWAKSEFNDLDDSTLISIRRIMTTFHAELEDLQKLVL